MYVLYILYMCIICILRILRITLCDLSYYSLSYSSIGSTMARATSTNSLSSALSSCDIQLIRFVTKGLAFRVNIQTASSTISISQSIYYYILLPTRIIQKVAVILFLILFYSIFLKNILYFIARSKTTILNIILITL